MIAFLKKLLIPQGEFDYEDELWHRKIELEECATTADLLKVWVYHRFGFVPDFLLTQQRIALDAVSERYDECRRRYLALEAAYLKETLPKRQIENGHIVIKLPWPMDELAGTKEMAELVTMQVIDQILHHAINDKG